MDTGAPPSYDHVQAASSVHQPPIEQPRHSHIPPATATGLAPVVMSWEGDTQANLQAEGSRAVPFGNPPGYGIASQPIRPINYSFSPASVNSMILVPPSSAADSRPVYNISVSMNCFSPSRLVTTIRRGSSENGQYVGEFELNHECNMRVGKVLMHGKETRIHDVVKEGGWDIWKISLGERPFVWDFRRSPKTCCSKDGKITYAKFRPASPLIMRDEERLHLTQLEVFPPGQELFDELLIAALILERCRLAKE